MGLLRRYGGLGIDGGREKGEDNFIGLFQIRMFLHGGRDFLHIFYLPHLVSIVCGRGNPPGKPYGGKAE